MHNTLEIVIINWNSGPLLRDCLESIASSSRRAFQLENVFVLDNNSSDASAEFNEDFDLPLTIIENDRNRGFAAAANQGAGLGDAEYLLFLNPDVILASESLNRPMEFMEREDNTHVGICGIQLKDETSMVARTCRHFPHLKRFLTEICGLPKLWPDRFSGSPMLHWDHQKSHIVDQVSGAFFLVRRSVFEEIGGFDERFFLYFEEVDFSLRARKAGWHTFYHTGAFAHHVDLEWLNQTRDKRHFYMCKSRIQYSLKHFSRLEALVVVFGTLFIEPFTRLIPALSRLSISDFTSVLRAYGMLWRVIPDLLNSPKQEVHLQ